MAGHRKELDDATGFVEGQAELGGTASVSHSWRFWSIFPPLCLGQFLIALEAAIPTASLPKITSDLDAGDNWVWIVNAYLLTKCALDHSLPNL